MEEFLRIHDKFYILATSSLADEQSRVLKHGDTFALFDRHGDIRPLGFEDHGLYHEGTRFLSRLVLRFEGKSPLLLSSLVKEDNDLLVVDVTNPDFETPEGRMIHKGTLYLRRTIFLWRGGYYESINIRNYGLEPVGFSFSYNFEADHVDIFEVRGVKRERRGESLEPRIEGTRVVLGYRGLDERTRNTCIDFFDGPEDVGADHANFSTRLDSHEQATYHLKVLCKTEGSGPVAAVTSYKAAFDRARKEHHELRNDTCIVETSNEQFNDWLNRSQADLYMMLTQTDHGLYPYAGIPWFNTVFGRDGIITALETLWLNPDIAHGVLSYLAARQATELIPEQEAEPGKILHEERKGEMAALGEIPFGQYYGTVDATPLFIILAGHYYERTGDREFIQQLWPHIEMALDWIDNYGDSDKDGFVEYSRHGREGLTNQGWKDSDDSVFHHDGRLAAPPIALCEVQGYVYEAKLRAGRIALETGDVDRGRRLLSEAESLRERFLKAFWCDDLRIYAIALDGEKKSCRVKSSNAGHCLFSGIATESNARAVTENFLSEDFFTGWGIRTIASREVRYNPMSYHNGSIWPHDNAMIAYGMARYGLKDAALKVLTGLFDASIFVQLHRLPELFCGFNRFEREGPTLYPVACDPQAWATGSVFMLLQACMGLSIQAKNNKVYFNNPALPAFLKEVTIKNLRVGSASMDITLYRHARDVGINVTRKEGRAEVLVSK